MFAYHMFSQAQQWSTVRLLQIGFYFTISPVSISTVTLQCIHRIEVQMTKKLLGTLGKLFENSYLGHWQPNNI